MGEMSTKFMIQHHRKTYSFKENKFDVMHESAVTWEPYTNTILQSLSLIRTGRDANYLS